MYCHTKRVRKIHRDFKTTPWQSLPTCLKLTLKLEKSEKSNFTSPAEFKRGPHFPPHTILSPSPHGCIAGVSSVLWAGQTLPAEFYQWTTTSKHFLKWPGSQVMPQTPTSPAKIPASETQDFWDWFSAQSSLNSKIRKSQEKEIHLLQKKPTKIQTKALWNCNLWISIRKCKEEACSKGSVYPQLFVSQWWHCELCWNTGTQLWGDQTQKRSAPLQRHRS